MSPPTLCAVLRKRTARATQGTVDVRRFGPGERFVFEPYTQEMYHRTQAWIDERGIFPMDQPRSSAYADAVIRLEAAE